MEERKAKRDEKVVAKATVALGRVLGIAEFAAAVDDAETRISVGGVTVRLHRVVLGQHSPAWKQTLRGHAPAEDEPPALEIVKLSREITPEAAMFAICSAYRSFRMHAQSVAAEFTKEDSLFPLRVQFAVQQFDTLPAAEVKFRLPSIGTVRLAQAISRTRLVYSDELEAKILAELCARKNLPEAMEELNKVPEGRAFAQMIRVIRIATKRRRNSSFLDLDRGVQVYALFNGGRTLYPGTVKSANMEANTCSVHFDDGDKDPRVPWASAWAPSPFLKRGDKATLLSSGRECGVRDFMVRDGQGVYRIQFSGVEDIHTHVQPNELSPVT